jgi:tetratricopeptide (TPR) repeat protein
MRPIYNKPTTKTSKGGGSKTALRIQNLLHSAVDLHQKGAFQEALAIYEGVLAIDAHNFEALHLSGLIAYQTKNANKGVELMRAALKIAPRSVACLVNLGLAEHEVGDLPGAVKRYITALEIKKDFPQAHYNLANVYKDQRDWSAAKQSYETAIALKPDYWEALLNFANLLESCSDWTRALKNLNQVLLINPLHSKAYNNRANVYKKIECWQDAINDYDMSIRLDCMYPDVYVNKGNLLKDFAYWDAAGAAYDRALEIEPKHPKALWNKSLLNLTLGAFSQGWLGYEARWERENAEALNLQRYRSVRQTTAQQEWRGDQDIRGKRVLLYSEQGVGDSIQFVRFVAIIVSQGAIVYLMVQSPLQELFKQIKGVKLLLSMDDLVPEHDYACPLMSLPLALKLDKEEAFDKSSYLYADPVKMKNWQIRLTALGAPKVGIVWRGSASHANDKYRSIPFEHFQNCIPRRIRCVSLQKEMTQAEEALFDQNSDYLDCSEYLSDFSETAALCANLDLVICVDTSVAHLAAALGKEVWILLPFSPDWRWMLNRRDSPWYANVSLYRQPTWGDWASPLQQIKADWVAKLNTSP